MKHQRIVVSQHGAPEVLQVIEETAPEPRRGDVRVRVLASGVSAYDAMLRRSGRTLPGSPRPPYTPGEDVVGIVDALGESVSEPQVGQTVAAVTWSIVGGGYAEYICLPASDLVPVPSGLDPAVAVCLLANYLTAHVVMHRTAQVQPGESILVHGSAGGVGSALLDLGRAAGLEMYATASKHNHPVVSEFGATPIDYRTEDFVERIRAITGDGVDVVFDPIGGGRQVRRSHQALRQGGRLVWFGMAATRDKGMGVIPATLAMIALLKLFSRGKQAPMTPDLGELFKTQREWYRNTVTELLGLAADGTLTPLVAERIPLIEAVRAHELLERGGYAGKVVLVSDMNGSNWAKAGKGLYRHARI